MKERVKRHRGCRCTPPFSLLDSVTVLCHWGNCTEWRCPACRGYLGGVGAIWCPCDGGCYRAFRHPGMENRNYDWSEETGRVYRHVAVKPSKARRDQRGRHGKGKS
jgi:hypothetical protein